MDGTSKDRFFNNRLFRPVSLQQALEELPIIIFNLIKHKVTAILQGSLDGKYYVINSNTLDVPNYYMRTEDYDRCINIINRMGSIPIFQSEIDYDTISRIEAFIRVEFSDRGIF